MASFNPFIQDPYRQQGPGHEPVPILPLQNTPQMAPMPAQSLLPQPERAPGILGATPSDKVPEKRSFLDKLLGIYGDADLSAEQRKGLQSQGLIEAGLAIMAASGQGASLGEALYGGLQAGKQGTAQRMAGAQTRSMQDRFAEIAQTNPEAIPAMLQEAIASGADPQTINAIANAANTLTQAKQAGAGSKAKGVVTTRQMEDGTFHSVLLDPTDGTVLNDLGPVQPERGVVVSGVDAEGNPVDKLVNPRTGSAIAVFEQPPKQASTAQAEAATQYGSMAPSVANIEELWPEIEAQGGLQWKDLAIYRYSGPGAAALRGTMSDEKQAFLQASETLATQVARALFGARVTQQQQDAVYRTYIIAPGDKPRNVEQTIASLNRLVDDIGSESGGEVARRERDRVEANLDSTPVVGEIDVREGGRVMSPSGVTPEDFQ